MARTKTADASAEGAAGAAAEKPKKKRTKLIAAVVLVLLGGYVVKGKVVKPHFAAGAAVPNGAVIALGSITANLSDSHLAQIGVSIQMTVAANSKEEAKEQDELLGSTTQLLGTETYGRLIDPAGRAAFRTQLLHDYQTDLGLSEGAQQVGAVYFTSFVVQ